MLDGKVSSRLCELLQDGDLLLLVGKMLHVRGLGTVRISKVRGHADEASVRAGTVRDWISWGTMGTMGLTRLQIWSQEGAVVGY